MERFRLRGILRVAGWLMAASGLAMPAGSQAVGLPSAGQSSQASHSQSGVPISDGQQLAAIRAMVARSDLRGAEAELEKVVKADPKSADGAFLLGYVRMRLNKPKESLAEYTRGAALRTPSAEDFKHIADDYVLLNAYDDADKWMSQAVVMDKTDGDGWYGLGRIRYTEQRFQDAVGCFEKTLALTPKSVKAEDNLGLAYQGLNRVDDAVKAWQTALAWQADAAHKSEQPMLNLGTFWVEQGRLDEALPLLKEAEGIAPQDPHIHEQLGTLYVQKEQFDLGAAELEKAVALRPENGAYHFLLGRVYHRLGRDDESKVEFQKAAKLNGTHSSTEQK